jgi:hypothetical protein
MNANSNTKSATGKPAKSAPTAGLWSADVAAKMEREAQAEERALNANSQIQSAKAKASKSKEYLMAVDHRLLIVSARLIDNDTVLVTARRDVGANPIPTDSLRHSAFLRDHFNVGQPARISKRGFDTIVIHDKDEPMPEISKNGQEKYFVGSHDCFGLNITKYVASKSEGVWIESGVFTRKGNVQ